MLKSKTALRSSQSPCMMESLEARRLFSAVLGVAAAAATPVTVGASKQAAISSTKLTVVMGSTGITELSYGNTVLFNAAVHPTDVFNVMDYGETVNGVTTNYTVTPGSFTTSWNASSQKLTLTYSWGTVTCAYTVTSSEVKMAITVKNTMSSATLDGVNIAPFTFYFPDIPPGFQPAPPETFGTESPGINIADFGTGAVALVQENVTQNLYSGFIAHNVWLNGFETWVGSTPLPGMPDSWPDLDDPIAPGASDTYNISLRFGPANSTAASLAQDTMNAYTAAIPDTVNWANRAPIGVLVPAGCAPGNFSATNPRGWFNDPSVNVTTPAGLAAFSQELLAYAAGCIQVLKSEGAQGMITWDIEGEQYPTATYIGDPRLATTLAPELAYNNLIGQYFAMFKAAGLETGVTIRPQQIVFQNGIPVQEPVTTAAAEVQTLVSKIDFAEESWGCTLFYIDSDAWEDSPSILEQVHKDCPNVLLIPEHSNTGSYASSAPFTQIRSANETTPTSATEVYSNAFMVIDTHTASPGILNESDLVSDVEAGDILMVDGHWGTAPGNALAEEAYATAAAANKASKAGSSTQTADTKKKTTSSAAVTSTNAVTNLLLSAKTGIATK
jgi:hypothetical protein